MTFASENAYMAMNYESDRCTVDRSIGKLIHATNYMGCFIWEDYFDNIMIFVLTVE